jgi:cytochrome c biogenesis protein CcdA
MIEQLTIPAVVGAALVDAINPCAFAVLILLMSTVLASGDRKRALWCGVTFIAAIYVMYFLMGVGIFTVIQVTGITHTFYWIVSIIALLVGLFNVKDYIWYGKGFLMEVPLSWRPTMKKLLRSVASPGGAGVIGIVVSFFLLPCTSGPYIVILGLLAKEVTKATGILYLLLYNLIFIFPMIVITWIVYQGLATTEKLEKLRQSKLRHLHLIAGVIMLLLGLGMIVAMRLGMV